VAAVAFLAAGASPALAQNGFYAVFSRDGTDVWAVGGSGTLYRSFDGGLTWTTRTVGTDTHRGITAYGWTDILVSENGKIHRSIDSGGTWNTVTVAGSPSLRGVQLVDDTCRAPVADTEATLDQ
jgi:photosystem II stability/assembly factor-like uncharacterized protein